MGYLPFFLLFCREPRLLADLVYVSNPTEPSIPAEYARLLKGSLQQAYACAEANEMAKNIQQKEYHDTQTYGDKYEAGNLVWLHVPHTPQGQSRKKRNLWNGPHRVLSTLHDCTYSITSN